MNEVIESGDPEELLDMDKAREVGDALNRLYPNHLWAVMVQGQALVVKCLSILPETMEGPQPCNYGWVMPKLGSAKHLARQAMLAGGELLERAGMRRGAWDGSPSGRLDVS